MQIPQQPETPVRLTFVGNNTQGVDASKGQVLLNGFFEAIPNQMTGDTEFFFIKRPGLSSLLVPGSNGPGRGIHVWTQTNKLYSVNNNKIYSNTTDLGVTMGSTSGLCEFAETRPGATTQYLGINDGNSLFLIDKNDTVIVMNNIVIATSSVANPTVITTTANHNLQTGNKVIIRNHVGSTPSINDTIFTITRVNATQFTIPVNVTIGGTGGTIGVFPASNTGDLQFMDGYWFVLKSDNSIWNCSVDDPTTWPVAATINSQMLPGIGIGLGRQNNVLLAMSDRHVQAFYDASNPAPTSPLANIEQAMQQIGCISTTSIASNENTTYWISSTYTGGFSVYRLDGTSNLKDIGSPQVRRSIAKNIFSISAPNSPVRIILTSGTTWTVPADFNVSNNTIEAIGGGGAGGGPNGGGGGGGGAYAKISNFAPGGSTVNYSIGSAGAGGSGNGGNGGDTTFNTSSLIAKGGTGGTTTVTPGTGGTAAASTGTVKFSGGDGGNGSTSFSSGGGGGGAAGPNANGNNGSTSAPSGGPGGQGDGTFGGQGGVGEVGNPQNIPATNGGNGAEFITAGSGGGGGGGALNLPAPGTVGNGGLYGGGGGGAGNAISHGGNGAQGVIVITYTPASQIVSTTMSAYILRVSGHIYYILNLFSQNETWVYDQDLDMWTKWSDTTSTAVWPVLQTSQFAFSGQPFSIVGQDTTTGQIWKIDPTIYQDNGVNFTVSATTVPIDFQTKQRKYYNRIELIGDVQTISTPVNVSYSDDDYVTFSNPRVLDMSLSRPYSLNWGNSRRRVWRISYTGNGPLRLMGFEIDVAKELV